MFPELKSTVIHPIEKIAIKLRTIPSRKTAKYFPKNILVRVIGLLIRISIVPVFISSAIRGAPEVPITIVKTIPNVQKKTGNTREKLLTVAAC
jgi:hypothetical protein